MERAERRVTRVMTFEKKTPVFEFPDFDDPSRTVTQTIHGTLRQARFQIVVSHIDGRTSTHEVGFSPSTIGTRRTCDIVVQDPQVSGVHCEVQIGPRGVVFRDKGSKNGLWLGTTRFFECEITERAIVTIGGTLINIHNLGHTEKPLWPQQAYGQVTSRNLFMRAFFQDLEGARKRSGPIVLAGERGTGRALLAQAIADQEKPTKYVPLDIAQVQEGHQAAELFGYVDKHGSLRQGALEKARKGLVFLGNIDLLPEHVGATLITTLRTQSMTPEGTTLRRPFGARVIVSVQPENTTKFGLRDYVIAQGGTELVVPPLRQRRDDIPLLVKEFLERIDPKLTLADLPPAAVPFFYAYGWPQNVKELRNYVAMFLGMKTAKQYVANFSGFHQPRPDVSYFMTMEYKEARETVLEFFTRAFLEAKLEEHGGNVSKTAANIKITRQYLHQLLEEYGLNFDDGD
jgi:two-component system, NtrC family, response regulator GlrR